MMEQNEEKKNRVEEAIRRYRRKKMLWWTGIVVILALLIGWGIWAATRPALPLPGTFYPNQGQDHVQLNAAFDYNSNPPSSGSHYPTPANWSIYDYEVPDKLFIHNLEHGGIWIAYKPSLPKSAVDDLTAIVKEFGGSKFVMAPRSANDADVALVAWTRVLKVNLNRHSGGFTDQQKSDIRDFYLQLKNHGPEQVPDFMPGIDPKSIR